MTLVPEEELPLRELRPEGEQGPWEELPQGW